MSAIGSLSVRVTPDASGFQRSVNSSMRTLSSSMSARMAATGAVASGAFATAFTRSPSIRKASTAVGQSISNGVAGGLKEGIRSTKGNVLQLAASQLSGVLARAGTKATLGLTLPLAGVGTAAVRSAADFDTAMSQLSAALDKPLASMGNLESLADQVGKATVFSARDAADAMVMLAKTGFSEAEIQAGALTSTMSLAAAGGIDLASAATLVGTGMKTFGLEASQSVRVADALSGAASASAADVADLSDALAMAGQSAAMSGQSIEMTTATLAAMADNGLRGSDAGTSLKTMLMRLASPTQKAASEMERLGMSFYDADGSMKGLDQIAGQLRTGLGGLTQEQRAQALTTMFGADAIRAANILYGEGAVGIRKYLEATSEAGNAQERAGKQLGPLARALESLKGSLETATKELGQALAPTIQRVSDAFGWLVDKFTDLPDGVKKAVALTGLALASLGPILLGLSAALQGVVVGTTIWGLFRTVMLLRRNLPAVVEATKNWAAAQRGVAAATVATEAAQAGVFAGAGGKAGKASEEAAKGARRWSLLAAASGLVGGRFRFLGRAAESLSGKFPRLFGFLAKGAPAMEGIGVAAKTSGARLLGFVRAIPGVGSTIGLIAGAVVGLKLAWDAAWEDVSWFGGSMTGIWRDIKNEVTKTVGAIKAVIGSSFGQIREALSGFGDAAEAVGGLDALAQAFRALGQALKFVVMVGGGYLRGFFGAIGSTIGTLAAGMQRASAIITSALLQVIKAAQAGLAALGKVPGFGWARDAAADMDPLIGKMEQVLAYNNMSIEMRVETRAMLADVSRIAADLKTKVPEEVRTKAGIDIAGIRAGVPAAIAGLDRLPKKWQTVLGLEDEESRAKLKAYSKAFDALPETVKTKLRLDAAEAQADAKGVKDAVEKVPKSKKVKLDASVKNASDVKNLQRQINSLSGKKVKIQADASGVKTEARSASKAVRDVKQSSPIKIEADGSQALSEIARVKEALNSLLSIRRTITYSYRTEGNRPPGRMGGAPMAAGEGGVAGKSSAMGLQSASRSSASGILSPGFSGRIAELLRRIRAIGNATRAELMRQADITGKTEEQIADERLAFQRAQRQEEESQQRRFDDAAAERDRARSIAQAAADNKKLKGSDRKRFVATQTRDEQKVADRERKRLKTLQERAEVESGIYESQQAAQRAALDQLQQIEDQRESIFARGTSADAMDALLRDLQRQKARGGVAKGAVGAVNALIQEIGGMLAARRGLESKWAAYDLGEAFASVMSGDAEGMRSAIASLQRQVELGDIAADLVGEVGRQIAALQEAMAQRKAAEARWAAEDLLEGVADAFEPGASAATIADRIKELSKQLDRGELPESVREQARQTLAALKNLVPQGVVSEVYARLTSIFDPLGDFQDVTSPTRLAANLRKNTRLLQAYSANMEKLRSTGASEALIRRIQAMDPIAGAKLMQRLTAGGAAAVADLDGALAGMTAAAEGAATALSYQTPAPFAASSVTLGGISGVAGSGGAITIDVHPSESMDERALATATSRELTWQLSSLR